MPLAMESLWALTLSASAIAPRVLRGFPCFHVMIEVIVGTTYHGIMTVVEILLNQN